MQHATTAYAKTAQKTASPRELESQLLLKAASKIQMIIDGTTSDPDDVQESLRYNTSGQRFRRSLMRDVSLHGQTMKAGDFVCLAYGAANRDERQFPDPDRYDIRRKPRTHLGFGGGVHACLGSVVARMAVRITFEEFLSAFPNFSRVHQDLPWMPSTTFRSPMRLDLAVH